MTVPARDERGLTESVQWALLWPAIILVSLGIIQAGLFLHGRNVAQRAAATAVDIARGTYGSAADARSEAAAIAESGGLHGVSVSVDRGATLVRVEVRGTPPQMLDLGLGLITETASAPRERVTQP